jgi:predicted ArsR family transcriptional regulator
MAVVENGTRIIENHCPFLDVLHAYPLVAKLEADLFTRLLGVPFRRSEANAAGLYRAEFSPL